MSFAWRSAKLSSRSPPAGLLGRRAGLGPGRETYEARGEECGDTSLRVFSFFFGILVSVGSGVAHCTIDPKRSFAFYVGP